MPAPAPPDSHPDSHPVLRAAADIATALKSVRDTNPTFMTTPEKSAALVELTRLESQLAELRLRITAGAHDVAETHHSRSAAEWTAHATRSRADQGRADQRLADTLDTHYPTLGLALRDGAVNLAQARVIVHALDRLPTDIPHPVLAQAEHTLINEAARLDPVRLARAGRRILDLVAPETAEAAEAKHLADLEKSAQQRQRLTLRSHGDGTTQLTALLPDTTAARLATYLHAFTNPRRHQSHGTRMPFPHQAAEAFGAFLEAVDPTRLPLHGGDATTVLVTISLESLRTELGTATLHGADLVPGDTHDRINASQARRLACTAKIIPAVLNGDSEVLDLGRARRLFTPAQRKALALRHPTCHTDGCTIPATWCEAHHHQPWHHGGPTNLDNAVLLCSRHHHQAHQNPNHHTRC